MLFEVRAVRPLRRQNDNKLDSHINFIREGERRSKEKKVTNKKSLIINYNNVNWGKS